LQKEFTLNCVSFINRMIMDSSTLPPALRNNFALHKILLDIVKKLMMNEIEIIYLSLYFDKMGWTTENYIMEDNLLVIGLCVKVNNLC
jgi:hypothetical protein